MEAKWEKAGDGRRKEKYLRHSQRVVAGKQRRLEKKPEFKENENPIPSQVCSTSSTSSNTITNSNSATTASSSATLGNSKSKLVRIELSPDDIHFKSKQEVSKKKHKRTASLTELRPEDRKKVANLIHELANLGSEKERIEELLKQERLNFETAIKELVSDQKKLLAERHSVQSELAVCQKMLNQLQEVVLSKPTSLSELETKGRNVVSNKNLPDFERSSALDEYISTHRSIHESMDLASDICSEISDNPKIPRISSTTLSEPSVDFRIERSSDRNQLASYKSMSDQESTINYSRKQEIFDERAKLLEEQKLLRQRLFEQEELLHQTQKRLQQREQQFRFVDKSVHCSEIPLLELPTSSSQLDYRPTSNTGHHDQTYNANDRFNVSSVTPARQLYHSQYNSENIPDVTLQPVNTKQGYNVGTQVSSPEHNQSLKSTKDTSVQAELPVNSKCYVGNRLVPSPHNSGSRNSSLDETLERTSRLLKSARKIIDEAKSPAPSTNNTSDNITSPAQCHHSYQRITPRKTTQVTPRKTPQQLFDISDSTLATDINNESIAIGSQDADKTELEVLEDVFYVR